VPSEKKQVGEMIGEILREIGALLIVLLPLDVMFSGHAISNRFFYGLLGLALFGLILGMVVERVR
jgi:hypothetical protein